MDHDLNKMVTDRDNYNLSHYLEQDGVTISVSISAPRELMKSRPFYVEELWEDTAEILAAHLSDYSEVFNG